MPPLSKPILLTAIVLVGLNLRPALASISPLIGQIQLITGHSDSVVGLLTTIPVLIMGVGALMMPRLRSHISAHGSILVGVGLIAIACFSRFFLNTPGLLLASAVVAGLGIAVIQSLLPGFIKCNFSRQLGLGMGLMSTGIMAGAAIASLASPVVALGDSVQTALGIWSLPALIAGLFWFCLVVSRRDSVESGEARSAQIRPLLSQYWSLCLFFGLSTGAYTLVLAWLPDYYIALGWSKVAAGGLLSLVTSVEVVAGVIVSLLIDRLPNRQPALVAALGSTLAGLILLIFMPSSAVYACAVLLGLGIGALFPLSLIVTADHGLNARHTDSLMALVQGSGYMLASLFPFLAGVLKQSFSDLAYAWLGMAGLCLVLMTLTYKFSSRPSQVQIQPSVPGE